MRRAPRTRPIRTVFVANRGEIAARIERTCRRLGIGTVLPERDLPPVPGRDATLGPLNLLDGPAVIDAARASGADAIHPGYGFLSENAAFAAAVEEADLVWIGPPPPAIAAMGDKAAARRLAQRLGVPVVPGYDGEDQSVERLVAEALRIGYPLLVKPAGGGGGKGMREVRSQDRLPDALAAARREAAAAFGDERLILERLVEGPRHVEVQVLFDCDGHGVHLGERDCSFQRRHQKVLEETPSPAVDPALRERLGGLALTLAGAVGYASAGTVEFLVADGEPYFLEMNTRLQVEHPVTEFVTGRDLVADQLRIAAGEPLGFEQGDVRIDGHAVEVRLYAEDAEAGFLPATGPVLEARWPSGPGVRVDAGVGGGDEVTGRFDPMLAKIVAHGPDRPAALDRLAAALDETVVLGLTTNLRFLRWLVERPEARAGDARVDTLERIWRPEPPEPPAWAWTLAATRLLETAPAGDPWHGGWRLNAPPAVRLVAEGRESVVRGDATGAVRTDVATIAAADGLHVDVDGRDVVFRIAPPPDVGRAASAAGRAAARRGGIEPRTLEAPMPGAVVAVHVEPGEAVELGDPIVTLTAMKMEHAVLAPLTGRVASLSVAVGAQVARGDVLAVVEPAGSEGSS